MDCHADQDTPGKLTTGFQRGELDYELPVELIAQFPAEQRDGARLLMLDRTTGDLRDGSIPDLVSQLKAHDLLVLNDTKVIPAKFAAVRRSGGRIRGLFEKETSAHCWEVLLAPSKRLRIGEELLLDIPSDSKRGWDELERISIVLRESLGHGRWIVQLNAEETTAQILARFGRTPLPPYIKRELAGDPSDGLDRERYQTVFARHPGAVAAPTAGLHLTDELLDRIREKGVGVAFVTLHVGAGTFAPLEADDLSDHVMHSEAFTLPESTAAAIGECRTKGGRVVAVGTTSVRVLEAMADGDRIVRSGGGETDIFIYPPYRFRVVDALLTNFHLPNSTLLALVMAFAGVEPVRRAYRYAVKKSFRFFSYGDAMLIQ